MPQNFIACDRDQPLLLPPDLRDWLDENHLAWFVIEAIEELDLEPFYAAYRADGHGRAAHEPKMMPGKYVMICNLPGHYSNGMYGSLTVR